MDPNIVLWGGGAIAFVVILSIFYFLANVYQKCGPNEAMIITGAVPGGIKVLRGGGGIVIPVMHQRHLLSLEVMTIEVHSNAAMITKNGVPIYVEGVAQVKVRGDEEAIATAAERFLNKSNDEIATVAHETLVGHLRAILGTMTVEELIQSFDSFASRVQEVSVADLAKMGLIVDSFTIKEIRDSVGYLEALGKKQTAEAKRSAAIGEAEATKETQIAQASASRDAQIAQAQAAEEGAKAKLAADTRVAESSKNFQVSQATYQSEVARTKASSDMMYEIVKAQSQQKLTEEMQKVKIVEAQKEVELQQVEVMKRQVALEAEITKPAEAEQSRIRLMTQAEGLKRTMLAEADAQSVKLAAQGQAEATKLRAVAEADAVRTMGIANAEASRAKGLAEAQVTAAKGQAEADAMSKKAEAYKQYNDAAVMQMIIDKLPDLVQAAASPLAKVGSITLLSTGGDTTGASKISGDVLNVAAQSLTMIKGLTGIDLADQMRRRGQPEESNHQAKPAPAVAPAARPPQQQQQQQQQPPANPNN
ncbi:MAG: SPFH domain-containing protein [Candidatus Melainabacteria bacterium]|nr:SPFH domain-containing protein [Candidatus Melainabacteria bacterium]